MYYLPTPHGLILFATSLLTIIVGVLAWLHRRYLAGKILTYLMGAVFIYSFSSAVQAGVTSLSTNILWAKISYLGYVWLTPLCFFFIVAYTNHWKQFNLSVLIVTGIIPLLMLILVWTNENHGLVWSAFTQGDKALNIVIFEHGPWFWVFMIFQLCLYGLTLFILIKNLRIQKYPYRQQSIIILIATLLPAVAGLMYGLNISPVPGLDWMPIFIIFTGLMFYWGIFQYQLLDLVPIARDILIEQMMDGMIVLDEMQRIIDINPTARKLVRQGESIQIGDKVAAVLPDLDASLFEAQNQPASQILTLQQTPTGVGYVDVRVTTIQRDKNGVKGNLLILMDITKRKVLEDSLNEANQKLENQLENIQKLQQKLNEERIRDPLTHLYNRRYLEETLQRELARASRDHYPISVIMIDIDHFKRINDNHGHFVGDKTLQQVSHLLLSHFRQGDIVCRYGGEEFLILMPASTGKNAFNRAEAFRIAIEESCMDVAELKIHITISAGVAVHLKENLQMEDVIKAADNALYLAKSSGRNRVIADVSLSDS